ncbi:MAG: PP2C family protein-serine/threonine phosphatase, partial [Aggregatilineales bacterium]
MILTREQTANSAAQPKTWFYWFLVVLALYSFIWDCVLEVDFITHPFDSDGIFGFTPLRALTALVIIPAILLIAWLVIRRAPGNVVGLFLVIWSATIISGSLRADSPFRSFSLNFTWPPVLLLPLYFPDGRPFPRRVGWLVDLLAAACFVSLALTNLTTPPVPTSIPSALFIPALLPIAPIVSKVLGLSLTSIILLFIPSLVLRYRRAGQRERLQMKWLAGFSILFVIAGSILTSLGLFDENPYQHGPLGAIVLGAFSLYLALFIPLAVANAIFRYRLYDIDILIRRTLIYSTLTAVLAVLYFAGIVLTQSLFRALTGQTSDLAIVVSTLGIAALFTPLRQRIQNGIDRRLYRRKYDAERTLSAFSATLRSEVDLDRLTTALVAVVQETMQPAQVSLWLREPGMPPSTSATIPAIDIRPDDPLFAYCLMAPGVLEIDSLKLQSVALPALKAAGIKLALPLVSQGELVGLLKLAARLSDQEYTPDDYQLLNDLATQAATALRLAQLARQQQIEARQIERFEQEMRIAGIIQQTLLPKAVPVLLGWQLAAYWQPAQTVGGDFYDFVVLPNGQVVFIIGDVTDKGVPAALLMASTRSVVRAATERLNSPGEVLKHANDVLCPDMPPKMFVTCLCAFLDPISGLLRYANAGHNPPYQRTANGVVELRARGMPLGLMPDMVYEEKEANLALGDSILFYSDGLVEAHNAAREMFGEPRLRSLLAERRDEQPLIDYLRAELRGFTGSTWEQEDDVTLVTLQRAQPNHPTPPFANGTQVLAEFTVLSEPGNERLAMGRV